MIIKAIITQLQTGSIKTVIPRGQMEAYPNGKSIGDIGQPYVIVYDDYPLDTYYVQDNTVRAIIVDVHFPPGNQIAINDYIEYEVIGLLHRKVLTTADGYSFQVYATASIGILEEPNDDMSITGGNDDNTISRTRRFIVPRRCA